MQNNYPIQLKAENISHSFGRQTIIQKFSRTLQNGEIMTILGPNGHGKSTLLQILGGVIQPNEGKVILTADHKEIPEEQWHKWMAFAAPYLELPDDLSAFEIIHLQHQFSPFQTNHTPDFLTHLAGIPEALHKRIKLYSSGMKQRLKLVLSFLKPCPILLLDEPCSNLDEQGFELYRQLIHEFSPGKLMIIASNDPREYENATHFLKWDSSTKI